MTNLPDVTRIPRRAIRVAVFRGAALALLSHGNMRASEIGRVLYGGGAIATGRATGGLLALRKDGLVDTKTNGTRAKWWITQEGREWLSACLAMPDEPGNGGLT